MIKAAKTEKYYDGSQEQIAQLQKDFTHSIDRDMDVFRDEIITFLTEQFVQRYYFMEGVIEYKALHDKEIKKATEILADQDEYKKILK